VRCHASVGQPRQVALDRAVSVRRRVARALGLEARVVGSDLLGPRVVRAQALEQRRRRYAAHSEARRPLEEATTVEAAVHMLVEQREQLRIELGGGLALHVGERITAAV